MWLSMNNKEATYAMFREWIGEVNIQEETWHAFAHADDIRTATTNQVETAEQVKTVTLLLLLLIEMV